MIGGLRLKPVILALVVLVTFSLAFVAFILAPLITVTLVLIFLSGYERWQRRRRQPGVRRITPPRSLAPRPAGSTRESLAEAGTGFGSSVGREL